MDEEIKELGSGGEGNSCICLNCPSLRTGDRFSEKLFGGFVVLYALC